MRGQKPLLLWPRCGLSDIMRSRDLAKSPYVWGQNELE